MRRATGKRRLRGLATIAAGALAVAVAAARAGAVVGAGGRSAVPAGAGSTPVATLTTGPTPSGAGPLATATARQRSSPPGSGGAGWYRLVQYPEAGFGGFYAQIAAARRSIHMEMYELADTTAERDLAAAAARHVSVEVLLDRDFSGGRVNQAAYVYLEAHGVHVRWAPAGYLFHIKATIFDGTTADVSTANLTSRYYATTRDAEVIDTDPAQVRAIDATFTADYDAAPGGEPRSDTVQAAGLVWSPDTATAGVPSLRRAAAAVAGTPGTAEAAVVAEISSAQQSVAFESEELSDRAVYSALAADARRGVACQVLMTNSSSWDTGFAAVSAAGCVVHVYPDSASALYIHEKAVIVDAGTPSATLLIGSQNASRASLTENRELGVLIGAAHGGTAVIDAVASRFASDFAGAIP